jgi:hypothetical protein
MVGTPAAPPQAYRGPGSSRSINGTASEKKASDHSSPFVRKSLNCTAAAPAATSAANRMRPARESGVVFGSEIMKKAKSTRAPLSRRCRGMLIGSPSQSDLAASSPV